MTDPELNAFLLARTLLDRVGSFDDGTAAGAVGAVVLYDLAVETVAKAIEAHTPPKSFPGTGYAVNKKELERTARLWELTVTRALDHLLAAIRERTGDERAMPVALREAQRLHRVRNEVQHDGVVPSPQTVAESRRRATDFLEWAAREFHGIELAAISRASLVHSEPVRERLEHAEELDASGKASAAAGELSIALEIARHEIRAGEPYRPRGFRGLDIRSATESINSAIERLTRATKISGYYGGGPTDKLRQVLDRLSGDVERIEDRLEALTLGAAASEYAWFRRRIPPARMMVGRDWHTNEPEPPLSPDEFRRALDFVTTTALHWQQFPSPVDEPGEDDETV